LDGTDQFHAVETGQAEVSQQQAVRLFLQKVEGFFTVRDRVHFEVRQRLQQLLKLLAGQVVVFNHQDSRWPVQGCHDLMTSMSRNCAGGAIWWAIAFQVLRIQLHTCLSLAERPCSITYTEISCPAPWRPQPLPAPRSVPKALFPGNSHTRFAQGI